jgi:hypothetical protein
VRNFTVLEELLLEFLVMSGGLFERQIFLPCDFLARNKI